METTKTIASLTSEVPLFFLLLAIAAAPQAAVAAGNTNHTVGGPAGWFFNATTETPSTNYSVWAANQTFNLGDYLIFNTNSNLSVIQTYNDTTYRNCSMDNSDDDDTFTFTTGNTMYGQPLTVAIPLIIEGPNYFFSDGANDGVQCQHGMAFEIDVKHGSGLPPMLNQAPPPPYVEGPSSGEASQMPPVTIIGKSPNGAAGANVRWWVVLGYVLLCGVMLTAA